MIKEIIEQALNKEAKRNLAYTGSKKWKPSSFGHCFRAQTYDRMGIPKEAISDTKALMNIKIGKAIHTIVQTLVNSTISCIVEFRINNGEVIAFVDLTLIDCIVEIKSTDCKKFKKIEKFTEEDLLKNKKPNILQAVYYAKKLGRPKAILFYFDRCSGESKEFELKVADYEELVVEELDLLNRAWEKGELPPKSCRLYHGYEFRYCGFANRCEEDERKKGEF